MVADAGQTTITFGTGLPSSLSVISIIGLMAFTALALTALTFFLPYLFYNNGGHFPSFSFPTYSTFGLGDSYGGGISNSYGQGNLGSSFGLNSFGGGFSNSFSSSQPHSYGNEAAKPHAQNAYSQTHGSHGQSSYSNKYDDIGDLILVPHSDKTTGSQHLNNVFSQFK